MRESDAHPTLVVTRTEPPPTPRPRPAPCGRLAPAHLRGPSSAAVTHLRSDGRDPRFAMRARLPSEHPLIEPPRRSLSPAGAPAAAAGHYGRRLVPPHVRAHRGRVQGATACRARSMPDPGRHRGRQDLTRLRPIGRSRSRVGTLFRTHPEPPRAFSRRHNSPGLICRLLRRVLPQRMQAKCTPAMSRLPPVGAHLSQRT